MMLSPRRQAGHFTPHPVPQGHRGTSRARLRAQASSQTARQDDRVCLVQGGEKVSKPASCPVWIPSLPHEVLEGERIENVLCSVVHALSMHSLSTPNPPLSTSFPLCLLASWPSGTCWWVASSSCAPISLLVHHNTHSSSLLPSSPHIHIIDAAQEIDARDSLFRFGWPALVVLSFHANGTFIQKLDTCDYVHPSNSTPFIISHPPFTYSPARSSCLRYLSSSVKSAKSLMAYDDAKAMLLMTAKVKTQASSGWALARASKLGRVM